MAEETEAREVKLLVSDNAQSGLPSPSLPEALTSLLELSLTVGSLSTATLTPTSGANFLHPVPAGALTCLHTSVPTGGIAHGPRGPTSYYYMLPMKMRVQGLKVALTIKLAQVQPRSHWTPLGYLVCGL